MSEHWPPEWGEPDDEDLDIEQSDTGQPDTGHLDPGVLAERLAAVTSALASMPMPALPDAFEARISAAIAAEASTRTQPAEAADASATARSPASEGSFPATARSGPGTAPPARSRLSGARRGSRLSGTSRAAGPAGARPLRRGLRRLASTGGIGSVVVCLVIAGLGFLIVHAPGSSSSSSSSLSEPAAGRVSAAASSAAAASVPRQPQGAAANGPNSSGPAFAVTTTGTRYERATLARQVRTALGATAGYSSASAKPSASASSLALAPSAVLAGCVHSLTGAVTPSLVDRATYAGKAAYVIAVPSRAWVVRRGCTAAHPELIITVALAGLSGNLCALISV